MINMVLSEEVKNKISTILNSEWFKNKLYEGLTEEERAELGMVYTPPEICIQMIEKFECDTLTGKNILDPTCGSGNLLIACLIAGADSDKLYGNDFSTTAVKLCRERLNRACDILGVNHINNWQIHKGDALKEICLTEFGPDYKQKLTEYFTYENTGGQYSLFDDDLTPAQEKFLSEVD